MGLTLQEFIEMAERGQRVVLDNGKITGFENENAPTSRQTK